MGSSPSKKAESPEPQRTESWSTLKGFVASQATANDEPEVISDNTIVKDKKIQRVKTWMKFPEREPKESLHLDHHLNQSIHRSKTQALITPTGIMEEENPVMPLKYKLEQHKSKSGLQNNPSPKNASSKLIVVSEASSQSPVKSRPSKLKLTRQVSMPGHVSHSPSSVKKPQLQRQLSQSMQLVPAARDSERLHMRTDASNNLRKEPTDQEIRRQIQRWKTEFALEKSLPPIKEPPKALQPKRGKTFYELRKAMTNRENVSLEQKSYVIQPILPSSEKETETQVNVPATTKLVATSKNKKESETIEHKSIKVYGNEQSFEYAISRDLPPGFSISSSVSELGKECKSVVEGIKVKDTEAQFRKEIQELLELWKTSGFLKNIEDYVLTYPANKTNSPAEISRHITSPSASYLLSVSEVKVHVLVAKAYAIYCWIGHNINSNVTLDEESFHGDFKPTSSDYSNLFVKIAHHANLEAEVINGDVRMLSNMPISHSWNAVKIGDVFFQLDCTYGSGYIMDSTANKQYTSDYFAVAPQHLILTHWPKDPSYQFLESSLLLQDLEPVLPVPVTIRKQSIFPHTWSKDIFLSEMSQPPVVSLNISVNNDYIHLSANLVPQFEIDVPEDQIEQNVYTRKEGTLWSIQAAVPRKGNYVLNVYCETLHVPTDCREKCFSYAIHCDVDSELKLGYPKLTESALTMYGFNLLHWNSPAQSYICQNLSGLLNVVFEAKPNIDFDHYILPGRIPSSDQLPEENINRYNTMLLSNSMTDSLSLYQLQAVFPSNGWWTVCLYGPDLRKKERSWKYTCLLSYYVYATVGLPRNSYPRVLAPHILFDDIRSIATNGEGLVSLQFASFKYLDFNHYLTFDKNADESFEGYSKVYFHGKVISKDRYVYTLKVIFPKPGSWYVHVLGKERGKSQDLPQSSLFKLNVVADGSMQNTSFVNYNDSVGESLAMEILNDGLLTFIDDGQPLSYSFKALSDINIFHTLKSQENEDSNYDYCTYISSEPSTNKSSLMSYTLYSVFPFSGKWSVQLFARKSESSNYSLVIALNVTVSNPNSQLCYPKINSAFHQLKLNITTEQALIKKNCDNGEFILPFTDFGSNFFTWSMELLSTGEKMLSNAFVHYDTEPQSRLLHVIFPKPGEWLIRLFSKQMTSKTDNFQSVIELRLISLSFKSAIGFPQVFEPFYSMFKLQLDRKYLPLISQVEELPLKVIIPIYSPKSGVQFCHDIDIKCEDESNENLDQEDQCKIISDPSTGQHKLVIEVNIKGKWTVLLYAKKSGVGDKSWTTVMKYSVSSM